MEEMLDEFRYKLLKSGYTWEEREIIVQEGTARYKNVMKLVRRGMRPLYRPASWMKEERALGRLVKAKSWYAPYDTVMFVQATPGEMLKKRVEKVVRDYGFKVKVVERGGRQIKALLQRSDVSPRERCFYGSCPICLSGGGGKCNIEGVVYKIWCIECEKSGISAMMYGETGRTARIRVSEHFDDLRSVTASSNLREHCDNAHNGVLVEFGCKVIKSCPRDPLTRQLVEAAKITVTQELV